MGQKVASDNLTPLFVDDNAVDAAADSVYLLIVLSAGRVLSVGFFESTDNYAGHIGLSRNDVTQGAKKFETILQIYDAKAMAFRSPIFDRAYAGVENVPSLGVMHTVLLD